MISISSDAWRSAVQRGTWSCVSHDRRGMLPHASALPKRDTAYPWKLEHQKITMYHIDEPCILRINSSLVCKWKSFSAVRAGRVAATRRVARQYPEKPDRSRPSPCFRETRTSWQGCFRVEQGKHMITNVSTLDNLKRRQRNTCFFEILGVRDDNQQSAQSFLHISVIADT